MYIRSRIHRTPHTSWTSPPLAHHGPLPHTHLPAVVRDEPLSEVTLVLEPGREVESLLDYAKEYLASKGGGKTAQQRQAQIEVGGRGGAGCRMRGAWVLEWHRLYRCMHRHWQAQ